MRRLGTSVVAVTIVSGLVLPAYGGPEPTTTGPDSAEMVAPGQFGTAQKSDAGISAGAMEDAGDSETPVRTAVGGERQRETTCSVYGLPPGVLVASRAVRDQLAPAAGEMVAEEWYYLECRRNDDGNVVYADRWQYLPGTPEPGPDLAALARQAYDNVPLVAPRPGTSPPAGGEQLVGFPTWLWIDPAGWQVLSAEATIPGFGVTVTATPRDVTWDMGNGEEVVCAGPGRAWVEGMDDADEPGGTDCSYVYQYSSVDEPGGRYAASVTTTWSVAWQASTGEAGTLADASRTTAVPLTVAQRQAVIHYGAG